MPILYLSHIEESQKKNFFLDHEIKKVLNINFLIHSNCLGFFLLKLTLIVFFLQQETDIFFFNSLMKIGGLVTSEEEEACFLQIMLSNNSK